MTDERLAQLRADPFEGAVEELATEVERLRALVKDAVAAEREACAQIADEADRLAGSDNAKGLTAEWVAEDIRARGGESG